VRIVRELVAAAELPAVQGVWRRPWVLVGTNLQVFGPGCPARLVWNSGLTMPTVRSTWWPWRPLDGVREAQPSTLASWVAWATRRPDPSQTAQAWSTHWGSMSRAWLITRSRPGAGMART
jgi:hypothetical protein